MTHEEHQLAVFMFARVIQRITALTEALVSKGLIEADDVKAYEGLVFDQRDQSLAQFVEVAKQYEEFAEGLGIKFRLSDPSTL